MQGLPCVSKVAWMRCFRLERWRTRCKRNRARSRSARTRGSGNQIAGTSSRRESSANTQASMRSVLQASGASPFTRAASAISTCQPWSSSWSWTKRAPVHRLDRGADRLAMTRELPTQTTEPVGIRRCRTDLNGRALTVEQVEVETLAAEIQSGVQHGSGPPLGRSRCATRRLPPRRPFFIAFLTIPIGGDVGRGG